MDIFEIEGPIRGEELSTKFDGEVFENRRKRWSE
jgi:hypothetical protein